MATAYDDVCEIIVTHVGVYAPQADSRMLVGALKHSGLAEGRDVLDLCAGTGVVAIAAAKLGAASVTAFDICPRAVRCSRANARAAGLDVDVRLGSLSSAVASGPYDVVVTNPPYVPVGPRNGSEAIPRSAGTPRAWDAGGDGRLVLDPLCALAPDLLRTGGTMLLVQSEFSAVQRSLDFLHAGGLDAEVVLWQLVPFGPVLSARASWLEETGRLSSGQRKEALVVIRADKRDKP